MTVSLRHPFLGHAAILASLLLSIGVVRTVYIEPRVREAHSLRSGEARLQTELFDLQSGIHEMEGWTKAHPGQDLWTFHVRKALPSRDMVAAFLRSIVPLANRHKVRTELIQPAGTLMDETVSDAAGNPMTYRRAELRFRIYAKYQDLGEYLGDIEAMDQLVVVRWVSLQSAAANTELAADVAIWLFGTP